MKNFIRFTLAAFIYGVSEACAGIVFIIPPKIVSLAIFLAPILGLMWGPVAAIGVCVGGLAVSPIFHDFVSNPNGDISAWLPVLGTAAGLFLASYLPYSFWHKWKMPPRSFSLSVDTMQKFLAILFVTFATTSLVRTITASEQELQAATGLFGFVRSNAVMSYMATCFLNDFVVAVFLDLFLLFILISRNYPFHSTTPDFNALEGKFSLEERLVLVVASTFYLTLPCIVAFLDLYQIYGMDNLDTWINFIWRCMSLMDLYIILIICLLFRYRRSIMLQIVFLVAVIVLMSTAVLGWGSSLAMSTMVKHHMDETLENMSIICRERLNRTFFRTRQAVNGMERQALKSVESFNRIATDAAYRENYLNTMQQEFDSIAMDTDGCLAYYLRLNPEFAGTRSGIYMVRANSRWEGALAPFTKREPIDLALYSPDDTEKVGWFYTPYKSKCATWIEPYIDPLSNSYVISYVAPLFVEGNFLGVVGVDIDFNFIVQELRRMSIYSYGHIYMTNRNGMIMYHKDEQQGTPFKPNPNFKEIKMYLSNGMWLGIAVPLNEVHKSRNYTTMYLVTAILLVAMFVSIGSVLLVSHAIRPLAGMTEAAKRIASGDLNVQISYESGNELGILVQSIRDMAAKLEGYVYRDKLTGLRNAAAYMSKARELDMQRSTNDELAYAVVLFDVNFLKKVNDKHGHQAGNQLLRHASRVICRVFKHSPVYRVGGDEFVAILEHDDYVNREMLLRLFDAELSQESFEIADETIYVSVARGVGVYKHGMEFAAVSKKADGEMYMHKSAIKAKFGEEVR